MPSSPFQFRPRVSRRRLLQVGGLGVIGLGLPELLWARENRTNVEKEPTKSCIFIFQFGGPSQIDTFDPKPHAPREIRGPYKPIPTSVPGTQICEGLPRLARMTDRFAIIRSLTHTARQHPQAVPICLTGRQSPTRNSPYIGSAVAHARPSEATIPSYVWLQNLVAGFETPYLEGGFLGPAYAPMLVGNDFDNPSKADFRVRAFDPVDGVSPERLEARFRLLDRIDRVGRPLPQSRPVAAMHRYQEQALDLIVGDHARQAFNLDQELAAVRDRYGRGPLGQNLLLARRLIEAGVRLVTVNAWCGVAPGYAWLKHTQSWDHHGAAVQKCGIFSNGTFGLGFCLPQFDQALSALLDDLTVRGLLDSTLVVSVGEFGRTPKIATRPYTGRHHWPDCYCGLMAGGGIQGGLVYGSSDAHGAYVRDKPVSPEDFTATVFHALGVHPERRFPQNMAVRVSDGQPVRELFASGISG